MRSSSSTDHSSHQGQVRCFSSESAASADQYLIRILSSLYRLPPSPIPHPSLLYFAPSARRHVGAFRNYNDTRYRLISPAVFIVHIRPAPGGGTAKRSSRRTYEYTLAQTPRLAQVMAMGTSDKIRRTDGQLSNDG